MNADPTDKRAGRIAPLPTLRGTTMKVRLTLTIDVDEEAWSHEYLIDGGARAIGNDVRAYLRSAVRDDLVGRGLAREVYLAPSAQQSPIFDGGHR